MRDDRKTRARTKAKAVAALLAAVVCLPPVPAAARPDVPGTAGTGAPPGQAARRGGTAPSAGPGEVKALRSGRASDRLKAAANLLFGGSAWGRIMAMETLQALDWPVSEPVVVRALLGHPSPQIRMAALSLLSRHAGRRHLPILRIALKRERYSGVRVLLAGLVKDLARVRRPAAAPVEGQRERTVPGVDLKRRVKVRTAMKDGGAHLFMTAGTAIPALSFVGAVEPAAVIRLGVRYKWFEFDVEANVATEYVERRQGDTYRTERAALVQLCPGLGFYSLRRSWLRIRHGFRIGVYLFPDGSSEHDAYESSVAGWAHLVDIAFSPVRRLWFEISPANLGYPWIYQIAFHVRLEL